MWYSSAPDSAVNITAVPVDRVIEIVEMNKKGQRASRLVEEKVESATDNVRLGYHGVIEEESLTRFDERSQPKKKKKKHKFRKPDNNAQQ